MLVNLQNVSKCTATISSALFVLLCLLTYGRLVHNQLAILYGVSYSIKTVREANVCVTWILDEVKDRF